MSDNISLIWTFKKKGNTLGNIKSNGFSLLIVTSFIFLALIFSENIHVNNSQGFLVLLFFILLYFAIFIRILKKSKEEINSGSKTSSYTKNTFLSNDRSVISDNE